MTNEQEETHKPVKAITFLLHFISVLKWSRNEGGEGIEKTAEGNLRFLLSTQTQRLTPATGN